MDKHGLSNANEKCLSDTTFLTKNQVKAADHEAVYTGNVKGKWPTD